MNRRIVAAAVLATGLLVVACGSDSSEPAPNPTGATLADNVVVADAPFAADARVTAGDVTIGTGGHESILDKLHVGSILASRRSLTHPELNPYGFLRRVTAITKNGGDTVIATAQASLADAITEGGFDATLKLEGADGSQTLSAQSVHPLGLPPPGGKTINIPDVTVINTGSQAVTAGPVGVSGSAEVKMIKNSLRLTADPEFHATFKGGRLKVFHGALALGYEARSTVTLKADGAVTRNFSKELGKVPLGHAVFFVGILPVEVTVEAKVAAECELASGGKVEASAGWHAFGTPKVGVHYENGGFQPVGRATDFELETESEVKTEGVVKLACGLPVELETLLYDSVGPYGSIAPVVEFEASQNSCVPPQTKFDINVFDELKLGAKIEILDEQFATWSVGFKSPPIHVYPKAGAAELPTCTQPQECTSDTQCGAPSKACSWDGKVKCCRTPTPTAGATKCLADKECPAGQVCGWNLEFFVCQAPLCN